MKDRKRWTWNRLQTWQHQTTPWVVGGSLSCLLILSTIVRVTADYMLIIRGHQKHDYTNLWSLLHVMGILNWPDTRKAHTVLVKHQQDLSDELTRKAHNLWINLPQMLSALAHNTSLLFQSITVTCRIQAFNEFMQQLKKAWLKKRSLLQL